jgi:hypothetical protein
MTEVTYMSKDQINGVLSIIEKDNILPIIKNKFKEIEDSEDYKRISAEILNSDEHKVKLEETENEYKKRIKLRKLYLELEKLGEEIPKNEYGSKPWVLNHTEESLKELLDDNIKNVNNIRNQVYSKMFINCSNWDICHNIKEDITARLRLTQPGNFDDIIKMVLPLIDVDKYLYKEIIPSSEEIIDVDFEA